MRCRVVATDTVQLFGFHGVDRTMPHASVLLALPVGFSSRREVEPGARAAVEVVAALRGELQGG